MPEPRAPVSDRLRSEEGPRSWPTLPSMSLASVRSRPGVSTLVTVLEDRRASSCEDVCGLSTSVLCAVTSPIGDVLGCSLFLRNLPGATPGDVR